MIVEANVRYPANAVIQGVSTLGRVGARPIGRLGIR